MKQTFTVTEKVPYSIDKVWAVMSKPADLNIHNSTNSEKISDTEWVEQTTPEISNHCTAIVNSQEHKVEVKSENSKFKNEWDDINITVTPGADNTTEVKIDYVVNTGAVFNMLSFKLFGEKIMNYSSNTIFKHIEKKCKEV